MKLKIMAYTLCMGLVCALMFATPPDTSYAQQGRQPVVKAHTYAPRTVPKDVRGICSDGSFKRGNTCYKCLQGDNYDNAIGKCFKCPGYRTYIGGGMCQ